MGEFDKKKIYSQIIARINQRIENNSVKKPHDVYKLVVDELSNIPYFNWTGIYLLDLGSNELKLDYYVGKPTEHTNIRVGVGVCGSAVAEDTDKIIGDVTEEENYLACSLETRSEIVVLIREDEKIIGQIDVDSDQPNAFDETDQEKLQKIAKIMVEKLKEL
ncbi:MAG: GAF domain-containing protein [Candidatus Hodarchaeales archaeon]